MKKIYAKLNSRRAFTLSETLMTVLILLLAGSIAVAGIPSAIRAYERVTDGANAQLLLSTTVTGLRRELSLACDIETDSGTLQSYTNGETGQRKLTIANSDYGIYRKTLDATMTGEDIRRELLVSVAAASVTRSSDEYPRLVSSVGDISYQDGVFTVNDLTVTKNGTVLAEVDALEIRSIREG